MNEDTVKLKINDTEVCVPRDYTILEAARELNIEIPTLCHLKEINEIGACRMCLVEVKGARTLVASCTYPVSAGMEVRTNSLKVQNARRFVLELLLSEHRKDCLNCLRNGSCELQKLAHDLGLEQIRFEGAENEPDYEDSAPHVVRDNSKCILCRRCVAVCSDVQGLAVIGPVGRGHATRISCAFDAKLADAPCVGCGQCVAVCPTGALTEKDSTMGVWEALDDPTKHVVVGTAPSIRAGLGECFGLPIGTNVQGKMVAALRRLGFAGVFDVDTAADVTIMEEGTEFLDRLRNGGRLPLITSCSPGWILFCEYYFPEFIPNLSSCKSPQQMFGALMKTYYAQKKGIDPKDIFVVGVMPCTAKKLEITRPHENAAGYPDVDASITSRELGRMISRAGIDFANLPDEEFDPAFGEASGAAHIFGATGGVMEAALRTVAEVVTGKPLASVDFHEVRGVPGIKEATYDLAGTRVRVAVVSGLGNTRRLLERIKAGEAEYEFIEVMACPGGCVNGGGQPTQPAKVRGAVDLRALRAKALYDEDAAMTLRKSHENETVQRLYQEFLETPGSHAAHEILHTTYARREIYPC